MRTVIPRFIARVLLALDKGNLLGLCTLEIFVQPTMAVLVCRFGSEVKVGQLPLEGTKECRPEVFRESLPFKSLYA
jgi:hypothetical protein